MKRMTKFLLTMLCCTILSTVIFAQERKTVSGVVNGSSGKVLESATVREKGTNNFAASDENGKFTITIKPNATLVFSYAGFVDQEVKTGSAITYTVNLKEAQESLETVVVTAMGIKKDQRKLGYATSVVKSKEIIKTSPTNFGSALYGKAPGVTINTQPGGATSAVSVQIRGISSLNNQGEPLLVVDGVIVRNGGANNEGYWGGNQRVNGNGLLDLNPENVESINILKGAAASALYGSDATFGVIVVTTKNGKGYNRGIGVDVNLSANIETVAVAPDLQTTYGPGYDRGTNMAAFGADDEGWIKLTVDGREVVRPIFRAYGNFGPKVDGRQVYWWDGEMRPYVAQENNWKSFYRTGHSTIANVAINNSTEKMNYRFSYTRNDYKGIQIGGKQEKNTFNLNSTYKIIPKLTLDVVANYTNEKVHNRPRQISYLTTNYGGMVSPVDRMDVYFNKFQTSKGYKWVDWNSTLDVEERLKYNIRAKDFLDFLWSQLANSYDETSNRLMSSVTLNYNIIKGMNLRGRFGNDFTNYFLEEKNRSTQPLSFGATGYYGMAQNRFAYTYGDVLLTYERKVIPDLSVSASVGYQARKEDYRFTNAGTRDGLTTENWFSLNASKTTPTSGSARTQRLIKDGLFGILSFDYKNYLFVEGTIRREKASTLAPDNNTFYYPGISAAFELNNAFTLPAAVSYSKIRAAYGIVGNPPPMYFSNVAYNAGNVQGTPILTPPGSNYGNYELKNEKKTNIEFGWENRFFGNNLGFDITYYNDKITDQIMMLSIPGSTGATSVAVNVGNMRNYGVELSLYGTPWKTQDWSWESRLNLSFNRNKVLTLMEGLDQLDHANLDNGSLFVRTKPGESAGNIYYYARKTDAKGRYIVNGDGFYDLNFDSLVNGGNIQPKFTGGFINTINYKNFSLNFLVDFRYGGKAISTALLYGTGTGTYTNSMFGRDAENGGLAYFVDGNGKYIKAAAGATAGPNGEKIYHDGMILDGVTAGGGENTTVIDAPNYYLSTYAWGAQYGSLYENAVYDNNFIKLREVALSYTIPTRLTSKMKMQNLTFTVFGRNLFYLYKTLPYLDPEEGMGTNWVSRSTTAGAGTAASRSMGASLRLTF